MDHGKRAMDGAIHAQIGQTIQDIARRGREDIVDMNTDFIGQGARRALDIVRGRDSLHSVSIDSLRNLPTRFVQQTFNVDEDLARLFMRSAGRPLGVLGAVAGVSAVVGADYMVDGPSWKKTTGEILKKTGEEKTILEQGHYERSGTLLSVATPYMNEVDHVNPNGAALATLDSSKLDYAIGDGDTVEVISKGFLGIGRRSLGSVRVAGIDTPETAHAGMGGPGEMPFAQRGKQYLQNVMSARTGSFVAIGPKQTYGRAVGIVADEQGTNYSYEMVREGLGSVLYRETPFEDLISQADYNRAEATARASNKGMWQEPFYYGAQAGIAGAERTGWNKMTPFNMYKFNMPRSPGTSLQQAQEAMSNSLPEPEGLGAYFSNIFSSDSNLQESQATQNQIASSTKDYKYMMADMQNNALMNSMRKNRGRGEARR
jgi:endonuclease YncB( thermonuclease family)